VNIATPSGDWYLPLEMNERLQQLFETLFKVPKARFNDALSPEQVKGWDSMGHLSLVTALEAEFDVTFQDDDVMEMESVGKVKEALLRRGAKP
jgi:acyl carrier protein